MNPGDLPAPTARLARPAVLPGGQAPPMERPPRGEVGAVAWLRRNLFSNTFNSALTLLLAVLFGRLSSGVVRWAVVEANWGVILRNWRVILWGVYPQAEAWRPAASLLLV